LSMWKGCAFANAARNGVFAALLAADGMTGPAPIFEGDVGFMKLLTGPFTVAELGGNGRPYLINSTYIKFWPAEYHAQSAIDAALSARYPAGIPNRITITLKNGRSLVKEVEFPRGHARNPMTDAEVEKKFRSLVEPRYGSQRTGEMLQKCWALEKLKTAGELT